MATTYQTLALLRAYSGVPATGEDVYLQALLDAAAEAVDSYCNTRFVATTQTLELYDGDGSRYLKLKRRPVISVTTVEIDGSAIASTSYEINTSEGFLVIPAIDEETRDPRIWRSSQTPGWARGTRNIGVTYVYGYSTVPADVIVAVSMIAAALYQDNQRRGVSSESMGPRSISYNADMQSFPPSARILLERYREWELGG